MSKRSFAEVFEEARAEIAAWPDSMKQLAAFRDREIARREGARPSRDGVLMHMLFRASMVSVFQGRFR